MGAKQIQVMRKSARPTSDFIPIERFLGGPEQRDEPIFALKTGGYGICLSVEPVDPECMTRPLLDSGSARIVAAKNSTLQFGIVLSEYLVKRRGYDLEIPECKVTGFVQEMTVARVEFLRANAQFSTVELFWCLTIQPQKSKGPKDRVKNSELAIRRLRNAADTLRELLLDVAPLRIMNADEVERQFGYIATLETPPKSQRVSRRRGVGKRIARTPVEWGHEYIHVGKQKVQMFSMSDRPKGTRPNLFAELFALDCDMVLRTRWEPKTTEQVRKELNHQQKFGSMFTVPILTVAVHAAAGKDVPRTAGVIAGESSTEVLAGVFKDLDAGHRYGSYSMIGFVHSRSSAEIEEIMPQVRRIFQDPSEASVIEETWGNLSAFYAMFPGNEKYDVRQWWMKDTHAGALSLVYGPNIGSKWCEDLEAAALAVFETRTKSPYFFVPYYHGLRGLLIIGSPGRGKSVMGNFLFLNDLKYGGFSYIFDVGGSYENIVRMAGGVVTHIGIDGPRVNPFSLPPTDGNLQFLFRFVRLLLQRGGVELEPEDENRLAEKVEGMYLLPPAARRLKYLVLPSRLQRGLSKWVEGGVYGNVFDNEHDELELARVQAFDFQGIGDDHADMLEPILFWILRRINSVIHDPANLGVPKHLLFDELHRQLKDRQLVDMVLMSLKTGRKNLAGVTLLTQAIGDLKEHAHLIKNACPMMMSLGDPTFDRKLFSEMFDMNEQELDNHASLGRHEALLKGPGFSKVLRLELDPKTLAMVTTRPKDRVRRQALIDVHGLEKGIDLFAEVTVNGR